MLQQSVKVKYISVFLILLLFFLVQYADKTIGEILTKDNKFNRFLSLADVSIYLGPITSH